MKYAVVNVHNKNVPMVYYGKLEVIGNAIIITDGGIIIFTGSIEHFYVYESL